MRDARLDFWRGLCLIDMVLVHLVHEGVWLGDGLTPVVSEWMRFAAGGFVLVAGLGVARVFGEGLDDAARRRQSYRRLRLRAAYLLGVHYAVAAAFVVVDVALGRRPPPDSVPTLLGKVLLLQEAPAYGDILPLYVAMLLVSPALLGLLRRGLAALVLAASGLVFSVGLAHPDLLGPSPDSFFPIAPWQYVFVVGLLAGFALPQWDAASRSVRIATLVGCATGAAALALAAFAPARWEAAGLPAIHFEKVPLNTPELARYLLLAIAVGLATSVAWKVVAPLRLVALVRLLGRRSLAVYVSHVFVQALLVAATLPWIGAQGHGLGVSALALALLAAIAAGLERWDRFGARALRLPHAFRFPRGLGAIPAGTAAAVLLLASLALVTPPPVVIAGPDASESVAAEPLPRTLGLTPEAETPLAGDDAGALDAPAETSQRGVLDRVA